MIMFTLGFKEVALEGTVAHVLLPQRLKFKGYQFQRHILLLAVKVATAFSLVGHQIDWIKYGLD